MLRTLFRYYLYNRRWRRFQRWQRRAYRRGGCCCLGIPLMFFAFSAGLLTLLAAVFLKKSPQPTDR